MFGVVFIWLAQILVATRVNPFAEILVYFKGGWRNAHLSFPFFHFEYSPSVEALMGEK